MALRRFTLMTIRVFGCVGYPPLLVVNFDFAFVAEMFTDWMLSAFTGKLASLVFCMVGYRRLMAAMHGGSCAPCPAYG